LGARQDLEGQVPELVLDVVVALAHEPLHRIDGPRGVAGELTPGGLAHDDAVPGERDDRREEHTPLRIRDHLRDPAVDIRDQAVGRAQVNADDARHGPLRSLRARPGSPASPRGDPWAPWA